MSVPDPCLIRCRGPSGEPVVRVGMPLVDDYLGFLQGRCRPNTVLAAAYDLRVFFTVVAKSPAGVRSADVLGFITAQRAGRSESAVLQSVTAAGESSAVATSTVARRLSIISGFFAYLQARGDISANPVPRGLPTRRERSRPGQGVPLTRRVRRLPRILLPLRHALGSVRSDGAAQLGARGDHALSHVLANDRQIVMGLGMRDRCRSQNEEGRRPE